LTCQLSSLPREEFGKHKLRGSGHRTISPPNEWVPPSNRRAPGHLEHGVSLCFLALAPHRHAFILEASKALWDANSTTVSWGCQGDIPIYCIPVLTSGMLAPTSGFPQTAFPGESFLAAEDRQERQTEESGVARLQPVPPESAKVPILWPELLTPASRHGPSSDASDPKSKSHASLARATCRRRNPWVHRHPRKFPAARFFASRRRTQPDSRLFDRDVRARAHPGTLVVR
jgi:hypothetical protein